MLTMFWIVLLCIPLGWLFQLLAYLKFGKRLPVASQPRTLQMDSPPTFYYPYGFYPEPHHHCDRTWEQQADDHCANEST